MVRIVPTLLLVWLLSISSVWAQPAEVMVIRHAEKPEEGHCLCLKGWQRAAALVPFFLGAAADGCGNSLAGFGTPTAIYAQKPTKEERSLRPMQTVQGLAQALKLEVKAYPHSDFESMVQEIQTSPAYRGKAILICWEHKAIPDIAAAFGVKEPPKWPGSAFDRVWQIKFKDGKAKLRDIPQQLMYGDSQD